MAKYEVLIKAVTVQKLSDGEVTRRYGVSKTLVHKLHHRWLAEGDDAFEPRSRRPRTTPTATPPAVRDRVAALRDELTTDGLDAGVDTIVEMPARERTTISRATVWRILTAAGKVTTQPQKRPRSSWHRLAADRPNELWQSDFTHVTLTDGTGLEVIGWLDDHSRYLLHLSAHRRVTGRTVTDTFTAAASEHGHPAATLTDTGRTWQSVSESRVVHRERHLRSLPTRSRVAESPYVFHQQPCLANDLNSVVGADRPRFVSDGLR